MDIPDAPWIGHCKEEYEDMCRIYNEDYEDYLAEELDKKWKERREGNERRAD